MLKLFGCIFIFVAVSSIGFFYTDKYIRRVKYLQSLRRFVMNCADEMRFGGKTIFNILNDYNDDNLIFLKEINRENIMNKEEISEVLDGFIDKSDINALCEFFQKLGNSDIEGQKSHCTYYFELFGAMLCEAQKELSEKGKLYKTLSVFGGLALLILII